MGQLVNGENRDAEGVEGVFGVADKESPGERRKPGRKRVYCFKNHDRTALVVTAVVI